MSKKQKPKSKPKTTKSRKTSSPKRSKLPPMQEVTSKKCPHCGTTEKGKSRIEDVFGFRNMGDKIRPQTYCRKCRTKHGREMKQRRKKLPKAKRDLDFRTKEFLKSQKSSTRTSKKSKGITKQSKGTKRTKPKRNSKKRSHSKGKSGAKASVIVNA